MLKRLRSLLAVWTVIVGCCLGMSEASVPASQSDVTPPAVRTVPDMPAQPPETPSDPPIDQEMMALERHARVDMILYGGRFGQAEWAGMRHQRNELNAIALALTAPGK